MKDGRADVTVIGLGVMGRNLALNLADHGFRVLASDPFPGVVGAAREALAPEVDVVESPRAAAARPDRASRFLVMVKAGDPVDALLADLADVLRPGDVVIDGGNSHWLDTERRTAALAARGVRFFGLGISGGREGARHGASLMAGGAGEVWQDLAPLLSTLAATAPDGSPCLGRFGEGGAGHFVKMAHNGIEYALMQIWAEVALALTGPCGLAPKAAAARLRGLAHGPAASYLLDATAIVLDATDGATGRPLVELIVDRAAHKGTGKWTVEAAAEFGVAVPTVAAAYFARILSATRGVPPRLERGLAGADRDRILADLPAALPLALLSAYLQGLDLVAAAARDRDWGTDLAAVVRVWRAGCIIRAEFLGPLAAALDDGDPETSFFERPWIAATVASGIGPLRRLVGDLVAAGVPAPGFASVLAHLDGIAAPSVGASIVQGERDLFGDHSFRRIDRPGDFHHDWTAPATA